MIPDLASPPTEVGEAIAKEDPEKLGYPVSLG